MPLSTHPFEKYLQGFCMVFLLLNRLSSFLFAALFDQAARLLHNIRTILLVLIVVAVQVLCLGQAVYAQAANSPLLAGASLQPIIAAGEANTAFLDRKSTRLNSSHANISYAVFCL